MKLKKKMFKSSLLQLMLLSCASSSAFVSLHRQLTGISAITERRQSTPSLRQTSNRESELNEKQTKPIIAIIGSGAVGCYYGARLYETHQYDIRFLMRGDHYKVSKTQGLNVTSVNGDVYMSPSDIGIYDSAEDMTTTEGVDWVIVALKSTSLEAAPSLIKPLLGKHTRVLAIMNGMMDQDLVDMLEGRYGEAVVNEISSSRTTLTCCAAVYAGMALVCSNKIAPGCVNHSYAGKLTGALSASQQNKNQDQERQAFFGLWSATSIEHVWEENLTRGRWSKMCWNLPFNGISVAMGGITVDKIVTDPGLRRLAYQVMDETISAGNADLESRGADCPRLGQVERDAMMHLSDTMGAYRPSTMLDFLARRPMEVNYLFRKALDRAKELNVAVPHLETLVTQIEAFQRIYNLY